MSTIEHIRSKLIDRSIEVILTNQDSGGGFIASPTFETYAYCWFRDGSFIAYALDLYGYHDASRKFFDWAANIITQKEDIIHNAVMKAEKNLPLGGDEILHTRYKLDGTENTEIPWENFQLDGFGTLLWAMEQHLMLSDLPPSDHLIQAAKLTAGYLSALWDSPCYDCWEEFRNEVHPHTLAAIFAGLKAVSRFTDQDHAADIAMIESFLRTRAAPDGYWQKFIGDPQVDSSLIGLAVPYQVCDPKDPVMVETITRIAAQLNGNGVKRYATDTYYGGGRWILLSAWLGWYYCEIGEFEKAEQQLHWIECQANEQADLPEQVAIDVNDPSMISYWEEKWGRSASPLLWSHANYLILLKKLQKDV